MTNKVILLRHGETTADKNNPQRGLTKRGEKQIETAAKEIKKIIDSQKAVIIAANTKRARQSAKILAEYLKIPLVSKRPNLRITNIEIIKNLSNIYSKADLVQKYFKLVKTNRLPITVEKPDTVVSRFKKVINLMKPFPIIIIVGHAGAIETFAKCQEEYKPKTLIKREIAYGQFIVLERNYN